MMWSSTPSRTSASGRPGNRNWLGRPSEGDLIMTQGRRTLRYDSLDEVMPEVERLLAGHTTVGNWSLAQICRHLATTARRVVDLPASTPSDPSRWVGEEQKRQVFETGLLPEQIPGPPEIMPPPALDA